MRITVTPADPDDPGARFCLSHYFALLQASIPGLSPEMFPLPDPDAPMYRAPHGLFLLAHAGADPVGCVSLRRLTTATAEVKRLWIAPAARGQGLARRLMHQIEDQARALGYAALQLDTNEHLPAAVALYAATGWLPIAAYTPYPATHWFGKDL
jgi:GNAT superfamily N-acetyltransferase